MDGLFGRHVICYLALFFLGPTEAPAQRVRLLVQFDGSNGARPAAGLIQGINGSLYGTTAGEKGTIRGSAFAISLDGTLATLDTLPGMSEAGLVQGTDGKLYGVTQPPARSPGAGTVFAMTPEGARTTLYTFCALPGCADGAAPTGLIFGTDGNLYGATVTGGKYSGGNINGGTIFKITPAGTFTSLYSFCAKPGCADGNAPLAQLVEGSDGNFYGTTSMGGLAGHSHDCGGMGCGTIFRITPDGLLNTLYSFCSKPKCADGTPPSIALMQAADGRLYGATQGTAFRITTEGKFRTIYRFCSLPKCADGANPNALIQATDGYLYGTTAQARNRYGTIFRMTTDGALSTLHTFTPKEGAGIIPIAPLLQATDGNFYGTTFGGKSPELGTVFKFLGGLKPFVTMLPASGPAGSTVTIMGNDLAGAIGVTFAGVPTSSFTVNSTGTAIVTTVPAGAVTGHVRVELPTRHLKSNVVFKVTT